MKKLIYAGAFLFLGTLALSSCKKDWACVCSYDDDSHIIENQTKSKAKKICEGKEGIGPLIQVSTKDCYLK